MILNYGNGLINLFEKQKHNIMKNFTMAILIFASGFHAFSAIMYLLLRESEKCMNRADMALIFFVLYVILKQMDDKK